MVYYDLIFSVKHSSGVLFDVPGQANIEKEELELIAETNKEAMEKACNIANHLIKKYEKNQPEYTTQVILEEIKIKEQTIDQNKHKDCIDKKYFDKKLGKIKVEHKVKRKNTLYELARYS